MGRGTGEPWVGESVQLDYANGVAGPSGWVDAFGDSMRYRDGRVQVMGEGSAFLAGFFDSQMLLPGDDAAFTFAIECTAVTTEAVLRLSGGVDPGFALSDPLLASVPLGTFTVTGTQTVASGVLPRDVADYLSESAETILLVECLSGTVAIEQVRLRIWPPDGPVGGWVTTPGFTAYRYPDMWAPIAPVKVDGGVTESFYGPEPGPLYEDADRALIDKWQSDRLDLATDYTPTGGDGTAGINIIAAVGVSLASVTPEEYVATGSFTGPTGVLVRQVDADAVGRDETTSVLPLLGEYGVDVVFSPDAVPGDYGVQLLGSVTYEWGGASAVFGLGGEYVVRGSGGPGLTVTAVPDDAPEDITLIDYPPQPNLYLPDVRPLLPVSIDGLLEDSARTYLVGLHAQLLSTELAHDNGGDFPGTGGVSVRIAGGSTIVFNPSPFTIPAYRYWSPTATVTPPLRQRNRDDIRARLRASRQRSIRARGYL